MDVIHAFLNVKMVTNRTKHHIWVIFGILKFKDFWNLSPYSFQTTIIVFQSLFKQSTKHLPSIGALEHFETVCKEGKGNKLIIIHFYTNTPREKWPNTEFLLIHIFPYLDWIRAGKTPYLDTFHAVTITNTSLGRGVLPLTESKLTGRGWWKKSV